MVKFILYLKLMRLHQPTGIWLLLWPCWWSIAFAINSYNIPVYLLGLFFVGAIVMRGAGCIINDIIDRDIDAKVARTKNRPLASGALKVTEAYWLLGFLCIIGLWIALQLNITAVILSLLFFIPVCIYPFMKRFIAWPQLILGLTFNAGAIIGWVSVVGGDVPMAALPLYIGCIFWTLGYDTIYAHQDKQDDIRIGVKSTAVNMQEKSKAYIYAFYLLTVMLLIVVGDMVFTEFNYVFYSSIIIATIHFLWQVKTVDLDNPYDCMNKFKSNSWFGWIVFLGILGEKMVQ